MDFYESGHTKGEFVHVLDPVITVALNNIESISFDR